MMPPEGNLPTCGTSRLSRPSASGQGVHCRCPGQAVGTSLARFRSRARGSSRRRGLPNDGEKRVATWRYEARYGTMEPQFRWGRLDGPSTLSASVGTRTTPLASRCLRRAGRSMRAPSLRSCPSTYTKILAAA